MKNQNRAAAFILFPPLLGAMSKGTRLAQSLFSACLYPILATIFTPLAALFVPFVKPPHFWKTGYVFAKNKVRLGPNFGLFFVGRNGCFLRLIFDPFSPKTGYVLVFVKGQKKPPSKWDGGP